MPNLHPQPAEDPMSGPAGSVAGGFVDGFTFWDFLFIFCADFRVC